MLQILTIACVTYVQKNFQIRASIKQLLTKYQIFTKLPQIPYIHINRNFSSIFATFKANCFTPINFMAGKFQEYSFSFFASCEPLIDWYSLFYSKHLKRAIILYSPKFVDGSRYRTNPLAEKSESDLILTHSVPKREMNNRSLAFPVPFHTTCSPNTSVPSPKIT